MDHIILVQFFLLVPIKSQLFFSKKIDKKQGSRGNSNFTAKEIDKLISLSMGEDSGEFSKKIDKKQGSRGNSNFTAKEIDKLISLSMGKDSGEFSKKN